MNGNGELKADLHSHTNFSDGLLTPEELLTKAKESGLSYFAITDHDNVDAVDEAIEIGKQHGIEVIPGVEISAIVNGHEVHILGYFFDTKNVELLAYLKNFRGIRMERAKDIVAKLNEIGVPLKFDAVMDRLKGNASIGRPHIATALVQEKLVDTYYEVFSKYIGDGKPAYVPKQNISAKAAFDMIAKAKGLSFVAHPAKTVKPEELIELVNAGIDGIEIIHPSHSERDTYFLQGIASQYFLLESGGSDYHGGRVNDERNFGKFFVTEHFVEAMKNRLFNY